MARKNSGNPSVDTFIEGASQWQDEFRRLRSIILESALTEELKWGVPCYTLQKKNVVLIHGFKEYCAILFVKGALLKDEGGILVQQTENVQAGRQVRFTSVKEIDGRKSSLKAYIDEAIEVEKAGIKVAFKKNADFPVAEEFQKKLDANPGLREAFNALTPGRQRGYLLFFSKPKQSSTRLSRVEKSIPRILLGKGLDDP